MLISRVVTDVSAVFCEVNSQEARRGRGGGGEAKRAGQEDVGSVCDRTSMGHTELRRLKMLLVSLTAMMMMMMMKSRAASQQVKSFKFRDVRLNFR